MKEEQKRTTRPGTLVLGMGNTIMSDDGAGIYAAREVKNILDVLPGSPAVDVEETCATGMALTPLLNGYDRVIIIDACRTAGGVPGEVRMIEFEDLAPSLHFTSPHGVNLYTAVELARRCDMPVPERITIVGIEIEDNAGVGETLTESVAEAVPLAAQFVTDLIMAH